MMIPAIHGNLYLEMIISFVNYPQVTSCCPQHEISNNGDDYNYPKLHGTLDLSDHTAG